MSKLKTELKHWDKYLSKFVGIRINCLDIGAYTGKATCWMLKNLCTNPYSKVYSVDRWHPCKECSEYREYTDKIEIEFDKNVLETGRPNQNVKINLNSNKAIIKLKETGILIFDIIFIDASHEPGDILSCAILSWEILNEGGILIFDDYEWDGDKKEVFKPKYAIDTFISLYKLQLDVLHVGYHYIVKKTNNRYSLKEKVEYYDLFDEINYFRIENIEDIVFDDDITDELNFDLKITPFINKNKLPTYNKEGISNYRILFYIYNLKMEGEFDMYKYIKLIIDGYTKTIGKKNDIKKMIRYNKKNYIYNNIIDLDIIINLIQSKNDRILINYDNGEILNKYTKLLIERKIENKLEIIHELIYDIDIYKKFIKKKYKYNLIEFGLFTNINGSFYDNRYIFYYLCAALNLQERNGNLILYTHLYIDNELISECIYILKKYYKKVMIINRKTINIGSSFYIIAKGFSGINDIDNNINSILIKVFEKININNTIKLLKNNDTILNNIKLKIDNYTNRKIQNSTKIIILYNKIYDFIKKNNEILNNNIKLTLFKLILNNIIYNL